MSATPVSGDPKPNDPRVPVTERVTHERVRPQRPGDHVVRVKRPEFGGFSRQGSGRLEASLELEEPRGALSTLWRALIGTPIHSALESHERLSKVKALAVFSSDALSSVAYAPEAVLIVLMAAGSAATGWFMPLAIAITLLLAAVATSYRQTIYTYPSGGGSYIVAHANLGPIPGLIAASALAVGYVLTVSVSIASGVDQAISAVPVLGPYRVVLGVGCIVLVTVANLRGIRESGSIFAVPTYVFLAAMYALIGTGLFLMATGQLAPIVPDVPKRVAAEPLSLFLVLRAFATGSAVMTGTEAISNGVPAFQPPESRNAARTLVTMATILASMFLGLAVLIVQTRVIPAEGDTIISQLNRAVFGEGPLYYVVQVATVLILILAANTAFADFPRLASLLARDDYAPHQLAFRADRLAFTNGIILLGVMSAVLVVIFGGRTEALLPLYAVAVFIAFTLSQGGMVRHWIHEKTAHWGLKAVVNGIGGIATAVVAITAAVTNFVDFSNPIVPGAAFGWWGAWIVVVIVPIFILGFQRVYAHYQRARSVLALPAEPPEDKPLNHVVVVPVSQVNRATTRALRYARSLSDHVTAVHVAVDAQRAQEIEEAWKVWGEGVPLIQVGSPYRSLQRPLLAFLMQLKKVENADVLTVILPEYVPDSWWGQALHSQSALRLKGALLFTPGFVVTSVPTHELTHKRREQASAASAASDNF